jgi:transposase InsO family protein
MTERARLVALCDEGVYTVAELCHRFGISRKTGYKWLARFHQEGVHGLQDRSRAPQSCPHRTSKKVETALVQARERHPYWGPKKLIAHLRSKQPELALPAPSTAGEVLKRHGLVAEAKRRKRPVHPGGGPLQVDASNQVWAADFKGEFPTRSGAMCYPLTISDAHSRVLLACQALPATGYEGAHPIFTELFRQYGLPLAIRTDNGAPFATKAIAGLSRLSVSWTKLGILHQRIAPGHPEQNGRHERMHRTLKAETTRPPEWDLAQQQKRFDAFRHEFNTERPHEALAQETPASRYTASPRCLPAQPPPPEYAGHLLVRRVSPNGNIKFRTEEVFVSGVLTGERVGLEEVDDGVWSVYFYRLLVGRLDERTGRVV